MHHDRCQVRGIDVVVVFQKQPIAIGHQLRERSVLRLGAFLAFDVKRADGFDQIRAGGAFSMPAAAC